ncbi:hypothetical protein ACFLU4_03675 [Chloroflexota bacterium]
MYKLEVLEIPDILLLLENKEEEIELRITATMDIGLVEVLPISGLPVIGGKENVSDRIVSSFKKILEDKSEDNHLRLVVLSSLKKQRGIISLVAPFLGPKCIDMISTLREIAIDEEENSSVRKYATEILQSIAPKRYRV